MQSGILHQSLKSFYALYSYIKESGAGGGRREAARRCKVGFCTYRHWLAKGLSPKICPRTGKCIFSSIEVTGEAGGDLQAVLRCKVGFCTSRHLNCNEMRGNVSFSYIEVTGESKWAFAPRGTLCTLSG